MTTPKTVSVWTPKGGVGKTLTALHLAERYARDNVRVLLVDHDPQGGALVFSKLAHQNKRSMRFVVTNADVSGFDVVIHDHAPNMPDEWPGSILVMPTLLDAASYLLFVRGRNVARDHGKTIIPVASRYRSDRSEQRRLVEGQFMDCPVIRDRAIYATAFGRGQTVYDLAMAHAHLARSEIDRLHQSVENHFTPIQPTRSAA